MAAIETDRFFDLLNHAVGLGAGQVNLVQNRDDFQVVFEAK